MSRSVAHQNPDSSPATFSVAGECGVLVVVDMSVVNWFPNSAVASGATSTLRYAPGVASVPVALPSQMQSSAPYCCWAISVSDVGAERSSCSTFALAPASACTFDVPSRSAHPTGTREPGVMAVLGADVGVGVGVAVRFGGGVGAAHPAR